MSNIPAPLHFGSRCHDSDINSSHAAAVTVAVAAALGDDGNHDHHASLASPWTNTAVESKQPIMPQNVVPATTTTKTADSMSHLHLTSITLKHTNKISIHFKSDIESSSPACASGIVHACKAIRSHGQSDGEDHSFAWIDNVHDAKSISSVVDYFRYMGYRLSSMKFIPYSSHQLWKTRYPHAIPIIVCDMDGQLHMNGKRKAMMNESPFGPNKIHKNNLVKKNSRSKPPAKIITNACLANTERDELHREIYNYFTWLHDELVSMETHTSGRRQVSNAGISVPALRSLISKLEGAFRAVQQHSCSIVNETTMKGAVPRGVSSIGAIGMHDNGNMTINGGTASINGGESSLPFLEQALQFELHHKVVDRSVLLTSNNTHGTSSSSSSGEGRCQNDFSNAHTNSQNKPSWRTLDFDKLYQKLVEFKDDVGHSSPPTKHPVLGRWVAELRSNKKALRDRGLEFEPQLYPGKENHEEDDVTFSNVLPSSLSPIEPHHCSTTNTHLTQSRVRRLDAISFQWAVLPARVTWEQRFEELKQFKDLEGRFPTNKEGTLGNWLKGQRKLYTKNDADFMMNKFHKLEEIGAPLRQRTYSAMSWEDRFQQLVEFGRVNRHFNVPNPIPENVGGQENMIIDPSSDIADAKRFYRFVVKLNTEYRALQRGIPSTLLTEERIGQLINIGFEFSSKPAIKNIPDLDWTTRIQQLEAFQSEMGHLRIDANYDKYSNIGGWAVEMSERYKRWQEGREYLSPDVIDKFNQLSILGFGFDVFPVGRGHRSWEDSFSLLLKYRQETGSTRVPHHYKADYRLGSWVAVQRKEYKLLMEGKPSRLTQERIQRLESVGFEWVAKRGHKY